MKHRFVFDHEETIDIVFKCQRCAMELGFNRPEIGTLCAKLVDAVWTMPDDNPDQYVDPCPAPDEQQELLFKIASLFDSGVTKADAERAGDFKPADAALLSVSLSDRVVVKEKP